MSAANRIRLDREHEAWRQVMRDEYYRLRRDGRFAWTRAPLRYYPDPPEAA